MRNQVLILGWWVWLLLACAPTAPQNTIPSGALTGTARFRDRLAVADQVVVQLTGAPALSGDQAYQGWLLADDGVTALSLGMLSRSADGAIALEWNSPTSENLLSRYARFQATIELSKGSAKPTGKVAFAGGLSGDALTVARQLFAPAVAQSAASADPYGSEYGGSAAQTTVRGAPAALGLKTQTEIAAQHLQNAVNAAAIGSLKETHVHLEHVINILEGKKGARFGDHDGDGVAQNPGDGYGAQAYAAEVVKALGAANDVGDTERALQAQIKTIEERCLALMKMNDAASASPSLRELKGLMDQLKAEPVAKLYQAAQAKLVFSVVAVK
jgi:hypothetical protein